MAMFDPFDFNHDGKVDMYEMALGCEILEDGFREEQKRKRKEELSSLNFDSDDDDSDSDFDF